MAFKRGTQENAYKYRRWRTFVLHSIKQKLNLSKSYSPGVYLILTNCPVPNTTDSLIETRKYSASINKTKRTYEGMFKETWWALGNEKFKRNFFLISKRFGT